MYDIQFYITHRFLSNLSREKFQDLTEASPIRVITMVGYSHWQDPVRTWNDEAKLRVVYHLRTSEVVEPVLYGKKLEYTAREVK